MMKALQLDIDGRPALKSLPRPEPGPGETLLRVSHCAICRTDAKMSLAGHRDLSLPRVPGHEIVGKDETDGSFYLVWPGHACEACEPCRSGLENLCDRMRILGFHRDGGFAQWVTVPKASLIPVSPGLPGRIACLTEPLACTLNALELSGLSAGQRVLIFGAGPVGLMMALSAHSLGALVHLVECDSLKLELSGRFREAVGVEASTGCPDEPYHVAVNAAPSPVTLQQGISRLKPGGLFCLFSGFIGDFSIPGALLNELHYRQLRVAGAYGCTRKNMMQALSLLADHARIAELLIEEVIGLEESVDAMDRMLSARTMKFVIEF